MHPSSIDLDPMPYGPALQEQLESHILECAETENDFESISSLTRCICTILESSTVLQDTGCLDTIGQVLNRDHPTFEHLDLCDVCSSLLDCASVAIAQNHPAKNKLLQVVDEVYSSVSLRDVVIPLKERISLCQLVSHTDDLTTSSLPLLLQLFCKLFVRIAPTNRLVKQSCAHLLGIIPIVLFYLSDERQVYSTLYQQAVDARRYCENRGSDECSKIYVGSGRSYHQMLSAITDFFHPIIIHLCRIITVCELQSADYVLADPTVHGCLSVCLKATFAVLEDYHRLPSGCCHPQLTTAEKTKDATSKLGEELSKMWMCVALLLRVTQARLLEDLAQTAGPIHWCGLGITSAPNSASAGSANQQASTQANSTKSVSVSMVGCFVHGALVRGWHSTSLDPRSGAKDDRGQRLCREQTAPKAAIEQLFPNLASGSRFCVLLRLVEGMLRGCAPGGGTLLTAVSLLRWTFDQYPSGSIEFPLPRRVDGFLERRLEFEKERDGGRPTDRCLSGDGEEVSTPEVYGEESKSCKVPRDLFPGFILQLVRCCVEISWYGAIEGEAVDEREISNQALLHALQYCDDMYQYYLIAHGIMLADPRTHIWNMYTRTATTSHKSGGRDDTCVQAGTNRSRTGKSANPSEVLGGVLSGSEDDSLLPAISRHFASVLKCRIKHSMTCSEAQQLPPKRLPFASLLVRDLFHLFFSHFFRVDSTSSPLACSPSFLIDRSSLIVAMLNTFTFTYLKDRQLMCTGVVQLASELVMQSFPPFVHHIGEIEQDLKQQLLHLRQRLDAVAADSDDSGDDSPAQEKEAMITHSLTRLRNIQNAVQFLQDQTVGGQA